VVVVLRRRHVVQVALAAPARIGKAVVRWEAAYGKAYTIQTSTTAPPGRRRRRSATADGGVDSVYLDGTPNARYLRLQGVSGRRRTATPSYELEVYPVA